MTCSLPSGCTSVDRGVAATAPTARTAWSREGSEFACRSSRPRTATGASAAVTTWTAAPSCASTQVRLGATDPRFWQAELVSKVSSRTGVVLQRRAQSRAARPPPKVFAAELPSDDEVELVTEWLAPPVLEGRSNLLETPPPVLASTSPPLYVPVIQRPAESGAAPQDQDKVSVEN